MTEKISLKHLFLLKKIFTCSFIVLINTKQKFSFKINFFRVLLKLTIVIKTIIFILVKRF